MENYGTLMFIGLCRFHYNKAQQKNINVFFFVGAH